MRLRQVIWLLLLTITLRGVCAAAAPAADLDDNTAQWVASELECLKFFHNGGSVITGRLLLPRDAKVAARTNLTGDGRFCAAVAKRRTLIFMAHGYEPLKVTDAVPVADNVFDADVRPFIRAKSEDLRTVKATLQTPSATGQAPAITCTLRLVNNASLFDDDGYAGGSPDIEIASQKLAPGQSFAFSGLSRLPYQLAISAPGHIAQTLKIDLEQSGTIDFGTITLKRAATLHIDYRARVRRTGGPWVGPDSTQTADISCTGKSSLNFTDQRDKLGNTLSLRLLPKDEGIEASFFFYKPENFHVLPARKLSDIPGWDKIDTSDSEGTPTVMVEEAKVYYFTTLINDTEIQLLFQASRR